MSFIDRLRDRLFGFSTREPSGPVPKIARKVPETSAEPDLSEKTSQFSGIQRVLFVCSGNMCRSPYGEFRFRALVEGRDIDVISAGTLRLSGRKAAPEMIATAQERGLDLEPHRSSALSQVLIQASDVIFAMENYHRNEIIKLCPEAEGRIVMLGTYLPTPQAELEDPMGKAPAVYRMVADQIDTALQAWCTRHLQIEK